MRNQEQDDAGAATRRARRIFVVVVCLIGALVAAMAIASASATRQPSAASKPRAKETTAANKLGMYEADSTQVWLGVKQKAAQRLVTAGSTPGSKMFRHFLSPSDYTRRFGPSAAQVKAVKTYLTSKGFTQIKVSANDTYVSGLAPASDHTSLRIPASLRHDVLAVTGRNDAQVNANLASQGSADSAAATENAASSTPNATAAAAQTDAKGCSRYWGQKTATFSPAFHGITNASTRVCGYSAKEIRRAYGLTASDTGTGETIAVIAAGGPVQMRRTLTRFAKSNGLPTPKPGQYREQAVNGGAENSTCTGDQPEAELDSQSIYATAPDARQIMVEGDDCDSNDDGYEALLDALLAPLVVHGRHPSASIESFSDAQRSNPDNDAQRKVAHAIALRAAAEGVSVLAASGDNLGLNFPASDPDVTAVGGTTLGLGAHGQRLFETGWSLRTGERNGTSGPWTDNGIRGGAGGGVSAQYAQPGYQRGVVPGAIARRSSGQPGRAVPDISADADTDSGMLIGEISPTTGRYSTSAGSGTSQATPLIAGIIADAEHGQSQPFGFLNPALYSLAQTKAIRDILPLGKKAPQTDRAVYGPGPTYIHGKYGYGFDISVSANSPRTRQTTAPGYDTTTGLGTPNGNAFIRSLRAGK